MSVWKHTQYLVLQNLIYCIHFHNGDLCEPTLVHVFVCLLCPSSLVMFVHVDI